MCETENGPEVTPVTVTTSQVAPRLGPDSGLQRDGVERLPVVQVVSVRGGAGAATRTPSPRSEVAPRTGTYRMPTPGAPGSVWITAKVTDTLLVCSASAEFTMTLGPPDVSILTPKVADWPTAKVGMPYPYPPGTWRWVPPRTQTFAGMATTARTAITTSTARTRRGRRVGRSGAIGSPATASSVCTAAIIAGESVGHNHPEPSEAERFSGRSGCLGVVRDRGASASTGAHRRNR